MTDATNRQPTPALSGRALAAARRKALSQNGKAGLNRAKTQAAAARTTPAAQIRTESAPTATSASASSQAAAAVVRPKTSTLSGRDLAIQRRKAMSQQGKAAVKKAGATRTATQLAAMRRSAETASAAPAEKSPADKSCGCGCKTKDAAAGEQSLGLLQSSGPSTASVQPAAAVQPAQNTGRAVARARRNALANRGKAAMGIARSVATKGAAAKRETAWSQAAANGLSGRQIAMARRNERASIGRGNASSSRPSAHLKPARASGAPVKVEEIPTMRGGKVTGTNVERAERITGTEPGGCRAITGTEYIGPQQYAKFCDTRPEPGPDKVAATTTAHGQKVTGTEVGRSTRVTGDEYGACKSVTGTEYLAVEQYDEFCGTRPAPGPAKVGNVPTRKGMSVTGTEVGRSAKVTGDEPGSARHITGTSYFNEGGSTGELGGSFPKKVEVTHTSRGEPVSGTVVGRSAKVTGDEYGSCRPVTGTEYISNEQYQSFCNSTPPQSPAKVGRSITIGGRPLSGTEVGRSAKVTGDEPGSCRRVTGDQYYTPEQFGGLCDTTGPSKVATMRTLNDRSLTGTSVGRSPKVTGDEYGGCEPVTGTQYVGPEQYKAFCDSTPAAAPEKVSVARTWERHQVSGTPIGRGSNVTGDEYGACKPVSGTPYIGPDQYETYCPPESLQAGAMRARDFSATPGHSITGIQPGPDDDMTGTSRGACQPISGTPYVGADQYAQYCGTVAGPTPRESAHPRIRQEGANVTASNRPVNGRPVPEQRFSIESPARQAQRVNQGRVTGTAYNVSGRITGPISLATGLISGTPEFRYRADEDVVPLTPQPAPVEFVQPQPVQEMVQVQAPAVERGRITGDGRDAGTRITGDDWQRGSRVTGTEGSSSMVRNPTIRGDMRQRSVGAQAYRDMEKPEVPPSRITGSSGNYPKGAPVTVSGGARG